MTTARVRSVAFQGLDVLDIDVEVQISNGLPAFQIVGLPDKAVGESRERVRAALNALGLSLPPKRVTVNLAPADVLKEGSHYDLPIALGLLCAMDIFPTDMLMGYLVLGELSLDGRVRRVSGVLPAAVHAVAQSVGLICPGSCGREARWAGADLDVLAPDHLLHLINHIKGTQLIALPEFPDDMSAPDDAALDMAAIKGQESAKRALIIAAAGGHNLLMIGPPGAGKSMLAKALPGLLPPLTPPEALSVSMIHSLAGLLPEGGLVMRRPFRDPHHSASLPALIGGGQRAKPGEISLAHKGVLFLDELPEFNRDALESLRQPLETGEALVARANYHITYPADIQLVAAMNPCKCGYLGDPTQECTKAPRCGTEYQNKLSGPLLDRFDMHIDLPAVSIADLSLGASGPSSAALRPVIAAARGRALGRQGHVNARIPAGTVDTMITLTAEAKNLFTHAAERWGITARSYHRLLRVARTIADLEGDHDALTGPHVAEALGYRRLRLGDDKVAA